MTQSKPGQPVAASPPPPFPTPRAAAALCAVVALPVTAVIVWGILTGQTREAVAVAAIALGCLLAAIASLLPVHHASRRGDLQRVALAALGGTVIRLGGSLAAAAVIGWVFSLSSRTTALWTLAWYLLLMVAEVATLVRYFKNLPNPYAPNPEPAP